MLVVLLGVGTLTACSTSGGELSARDQEIREVSMGSDCVIAFLDESDAEGLYPATEEDPLAGTDTQFRDGGDAATVTGSMLMQSLEGRIVEGAYTCEATLSDAGDVMPVWDLDVTTTWEQPAAGAVPTYPSGFVHSVDRALESWLWLRDPGTVVPGGRMEISGSDVVCSAGFLAERDGRTTLLTATLCGAPDTQLTVDEPIGTVVESVDNGHGPEIALVALEDGVSTSPGLAFPEPLLGVRDLAWLEENSPRLCHLGAGTGLSCGEYEGTVAEGLFRFTAAINWDDAGGPVFAVTDEGLWAVGIVSGGNPGSGVVGVTAIAPWFDTWGLTLLGTSGD